MKRTFPQLPLLILTTAVAATVTSGQMPGDRPAVNPRATRSTVLSMNGMIATSQPLASAAGLKVLQDGGNAIDAAVTAAAVLSVVEPTMNGIGGDLFALVYSARDSKLYGLNASGRAAAAATPEVFDQRGLKAIPRNGVLSISVPGVIGGWSELLQKHGTITLSEALKPAIGYARNGYPVSDIIATDWATATRLLQNDADAAATFLVNGRTPAAGQVFKNPNLAKTLELIGAQGRDAFYKGAIAQAIVAAVKAKGGLLDVRDFADHRDDWVEPITTSYRGYDVFELPPNTHGFTVLEMLNILEGYDIKSLGHNSAGYIHLVTEAQRIAYADREAYLADPESVPTSTLKFVLSKDYAAKRREQIDLSRTVARYDPATLPTPSTPQDGRIAPDGHGDTIYLTVADGKGNMVSLIQSLFDTFGSGVVAGNTGIALHNRATLFTLQPGHPNRIAPGKRPFHTLIPAFVMKDGKPWMSFGVMGGDMQPPGHVQVLVNLIDFGMTLQEAGEAARFRHVANGIFVESPIAGRADLVFALNRRGHRMILGVDQWGGFQGIIRDPATGILMGGSDPRKDGVAIGF